MNAKIKKQMSNCHGVFVFSLILYASISSDVVLGQQSPAQSESLDDQIIVAIKIHNDESAPQLEKTDLNNLFRDESLQHERIIQSLMSIFNDPKSRDVTKGYAAYYLGMLRATKAVDSLVTDIALALPKTGHLYDDESPWRYEPAVTALISIGMPAIPAVIRNVAESDDAKVRELSLKVLCRIDGDKDIVQLRLQKALAAEKDPQKQARLQSALKALAETSFGTAQPQ